MEPLYEQLLRLQQVPGAYAAWADYRDALTAFIIGHAEKGSTVTIVGAGACNDFDLQKIRTHFSEVYLVDLHESVLLQGLRRQKIASANVHIIKADLLGIPEADYRDMCDTLLSELRQQARSNKPDGARFTQQFLAFAEDAFQRRRPDNLAQAGCAADYVVCCGVHSQLTALFPQMANVYRHYLPLNIERVYQQTQRMNDTVAQELNANLLRLAKRGVYFGLEERRIGMAGGIEGAAQALTDLQEGCAEPVAETRLLWPFDRSQGKLYDMRILLVSAAERH